jgi:hypothetical protein
MNMRWCFNIIINTTTTIKYSNISNERRKVASFLLKKKRSFTSSGVTVTTQDGTNLFFTWLEDMFGGNSLATTLQQPRDGAVISSSQLRSEDLRRLFTHEVSVLHVLNFYPRQSAIDLGKELAQQALFQQQRQQRQHGQNGELNNWKISTSKGLESSDVLTLGAHLPFNIACANNMLDDYYRNVPRELRQRRRYDDHDHHHHNGNNNNNNKIISRAKLLWPLDQLRLELDEVWPQGAGLASHRGGGLPRIMMGPTRWKRGFVHVDELAPLSKQRGLFSANIYLQMPQLSHGTSLATPQPIKPQPVLEVWPLNIQNRWDWYRVSGVCVLFSIYFMVVFLSTDTVNHVLRQN